MAKSSIKRLLYSIQETGRFEKLKIFEVNRQFIWKTAMRYYLLGMLDKWIMTENRYKLFTRLPTPNDWLTGSPLQTRASGMVDTSTLLTTAVEHVKKGLESSTTSLMHISQLYKLSETCRLIDIDDHRDAEFIKAIPRIKSLPLRMYTSGDFTIYFVNSRYIVLRMRNPGEDNYFIKTYDLGGVLLYIVESLKAMPQDNTPSIELAVTKQVVTTHMPYANKHLHLLETKSPKEAYWFMESKIHQRYPMYVVQYKPRQFQDSQGMGIPDDIWDRLVRDFNIPTTSKLNRVVKQCHKSTQNTVNR